MIVAERGLKIMATVLDIVIYQKKRGRIASTHELKALQNRLSLVKLRKRKLKIHSVLLIRCVLVQLVKTGVCSPEEWADTIKCSLLFSLS